MVRVQQTFQERELALPLALKVNPLTDTVGWTGSCLHFSIENQPNATYRLLCDIRSTYCEHNTKALLPADGCSTNSTPHMVTDRLRTTNEDNSIIQLP